MKKKSMQTKRKKQNYKKSTNTFLEAMNGEDVVISKRDKLKDVQFSLKDKHSRESALIKFFEENNECPTCEQHIDETFKSEKIKQNQTSVAKLKKVCKKCLKR